MARRATVLLLLFAARGAAAQWFPHDSSGSVSVWAGPATMQLSSELTNDFSGTTFEVGLGYRFWGLGDSRWGRLSLEFVMTGVDGGIATLPLASPSYPADTAGFTLGWLGLRADILAPEDSRFTPWLGLGYGLGVLNWKTYANMDGGLGPVFSVGADLELYGGLMLRGSYAAYRAHSGPRIHASELSASLVFEFFRPRHHWKPQWGAPATPPPPPPPPPTTPAPSAAPPPPPPAPVPPER